MMKIPYGRQSLTEKDIESVVEVLRSDQWTQGPKIPEFEKAFAAYVGSKYALAVSNGTAALHLCNLALDVKPGDKVITTPITFSASANSVLYCGGEVVFSDIDPDSWLIDLDKVRNLLENTPMGTFKGIIPVDFTGRPVDLESIRNLADEFGLWIIEDACHAPGGWFKDSKGTAQRCGNGQFADLAIFSFHPVKHIATGEGGMITTNDQYLYERLLKLRTHGITKDIQRFANSSSFAGGDDAYPGWYMEMQELGYNYRLTDFQAALGLSQLERADSGLNRRVEIACYYDAAFRDMKGIKKQSGLVEGHAYHLYVLESDNRYGLYKHLHRNGILAQIHYIPVHLMPYYRGLGWKLGDLPHAEAYYKQCISLPMFPALSNDQLDFIVGKVREFHG